MADWLNLGQNLKVNAKKFPDTVALSDNKRAFTYPQLNKRVNKLAHALHSLGLNKGDKVAVLLENTIEIVELYLATAKTGLIIVPVNFRLIDSEVEYIIDHSEAKAFVVQDEFTATVNPVKTRLTGIENGRFIVVGEVQEGYVEYESWIEGMAETEPDVKVNGDDTWVLLYTSGTTGAPKGVLRSHRSYVAFYLINAVDFGFNEHDVCMNIMPLYHVNSTYFTFTFTYVGATVYIHPARSFKAEEILEIIERQKITFISLIPTHYHLILNATEEANRYDTSSVKKLLCSSAPASKKMKTDIMEFFPGVELYEGYGSTEAGIVTVLKPEDQLKKLGSIGYESLGTDNVKILDENGNEVRPGEVGELYSKGPMLFDAYYKMPEKTASSFRGEWFSAGDMAMRDEDGFYYLVDRKDNMIITGGEHVYPSEVEKVICTHERVLDAAVIGLPDEKWGERVCAVVIPKIEMDDTIIVDFCRDKMARFKRPKQVIFVMEKEMPRTATGKILHRVLRERYQEE